MNSSRKPLAYEFILKYVRQRVITIRCTTWWLPNRFSLAMVITNNSGREGKASGQGNLLS